MQALFSEWGKKMTNSADVYVRYALHRDMNHLTDYEVAKTLRIGRSTFSDWKSGKTFPKVEKLIAIASFLGMSLDYFLLGKENDQAVRLNERETQLLDAFNELNNDGKERAFEYLTMLQGQPQFLKKNNQCEIFEEEAE